ncbi:MAG: hypothetical protein AAB966_00230 [Patescibacteria group bacterium]
MSDVLHLELGAANHTSVYNNKDSPIRFSVLDKTLQDITETYGSKGTIFLNDVDPDGLKLAVLFAKSWVTDRGYSRIKIIPILGDYTKVDLPNVKSLHLTNPFWTQLPNKKYPEKIKSTTESLERIAALSESGLVITTYFTNEMIHLKQFISPTSTLKNAKKNGYRYYFPGGQDPGYADPKVFVLKSKGISCRFLFTL